MLEIVDHLSKLDMTSLKYVYMQSIEIAGKNRYSQLSENMQILEAEQDFYYDVSEFFKIPGAAYALWSVERRCVAALRFEPYRDGYLITSLETALKDRRKGYATSLLKSLFVYLASAGAGKVYSHVAASNTASVQLHDLLQFQIISDHAVFVDGTVHYDTQTLFLELKNPTC